MLEQAIHDAILADSTIAGLVSNRVRPMVNAQDDVQPRIAYQVRSNESLTQFDGPTGYFSASVEVDCIGDTGIDCATLATNVKRVLDGYSGNIGGCYIVPSRLTDETDEQQALIEGTGQVVFLRTLTFDIFYRLTV